MIQRQSEPEIVMNFFKNIQTVQFSKIEIGIPAQYPIIKTLDIESDDKRFGLFRSCSRAFDPFGQVASSYNDDDGS